MRPAQKAPENADRQMHRHGASVASMRPAQKAPENARDAAKDIDLGAGFNEAGAKSAGKRGFYLTAGPSFEMLQ